MDDSVFCDSVNESLTDADNQPARCMELVGHNNCHHYFDQVGHTYAWLAAEGATVAVRDGQSVYAHGQLMPW